MKLSNDEKGMITFLLVGGAAAMLGFLLATAIY